MTLSPRALTVIAVGAIALAGCDVSAPSEESAVSSSESSIESTNAPVGAEYAEPGQQLHCDELPFVENVFWTTDFGPARADVRLEKSNFLECESPSYALCYYSGGEPLPCTVDLDRGIAECVCVPYVNGSYTNYIEISGILNTCAYIETVRDCGWDGSGCADVNSAPACDYLNDLPQRLQPGAELVSTFSLEQPLDFEFGCTDCQPGLYAGCMTAPCYYQTNEAGEWSVVCECPLYEGPFQIGQDDATCDAGEGRVWSAAYRPGGCKQDVVPTPAGG